MRYLLIFFLVITTSSSLSSQNTIIVEAGPIEHTDIDGHILDTYSSIDISDCSSIQFSVDYSFNLPWIGSGNMESCDDCPSCPCDPEDPNAAGCNNATACGWDFMWMQFLIGTNEVDSELIGEAGTTDFEQFGTYVSPTFCRDGETEAEIIITNQNWSLTETNTFENVVIICWEGTPEITTNSPICNGTALTLDGDAGDDSIVTDWEWTNSGTGVIADDQAQNTTAINAEDNEVYTLTTTDVNSCTATDEVTVNLSSSFDATLDTPSGGEVVVCEDGCASSDYTLEFSFSGGTPPYDIVIGGLPFPLTINNLPTNFITICSGPAGNTDLNADPIILSIPSIFFDLQFELISVMDQNGCTGVINGGSSAVIDVLLQDKPNIDPPTVMDECLAPGETINLREKYDEQIGDGEYVEWLATPDLTDLITTPTAYDIADGNPVYAAVLDDPCFSDIIEVQLQIVPSPIITITEPIIYNC